MTGFGVFEIYPMKFVFKLFFIALNMVSAIYINPSKIKGRDWWLSVSGGIKI